MNIPFDLFKHYCNCHLHCSCLHPNNIGKAYAQLFCDERICPVVNLAKAMKGPAEAVPFSEKTYDNYR